MAVDVAVVTTSSLGDRSYLVSDGRSAVVVDPQRDVDRILATAGRLGAGVTHVVETHLHNDYVSGGPELARLTGADLLVAAGEEIGTRRVPVRDGDLVEVGDRFRLRALATPGHTVNHLSYVLEEPAGDAGDWTTTGVFTGGSLLFGTVGRTDLLGADQTVELARAQHASVRRLADRLPDGTPIWPTHGFGSFCSARQVNDADSTVGRERTVNPAFRLAVDEFVAQLLTDLDAYPSYYAHLGAVNRAGPAPVDLTPLDAASPAELADRTAAGEWVVDVRSRTAYLPRHLAGAVNLGLDGPMAPWLGWLAGRQVPVTLLADTLDQLAEARRELVRIGVDRPAAVAPGGPDSWTNRPDRLRRLPATDFAALAAALAGRTPPGIPAPDLVLDVRLTHEWRAGHVCGARHIPLYELPARLPEVGDGVVWVHCGSGYRSAAAASMLANAGRRVVLVDDRFDRAASVGVPLAR